MIEELKRMCELVGELPEAEQQALTRAFLATIDAYFTGQQMAVLDPHITGRWRGTGRSNW
jgi:hypothetical protein